MNRSSIVSLTLSMLLCSSCATSDLTDYPADLWPALSRSAPCATTSGGYEGTTEDVWPTAAMRGSKAKTRRSLASILAEVAPVSRPENLQTVRRVELNVSSRQAKLLGAWDDVVDLTGWECSEDGALVVSIKRDADG